jgi:hypothetical protein
MNQLRQNGNKAVIVVEFRESSNDKFAFKCNIAEKLVIGTCEYCSRKNIMRTICKCNRVKYCDDDCMEKDKRWHTDKCSANADADLA